MDLNVVFDVPPQIAKGLRDGSLERVGGVVRDSSSKQVVTWLQEGGSEITKALVQPPIAGINLGVSVVGFAAVLQQLNCISEQIKSVEAKVDQVNHKLDDGWLAKLKAGINACQNAVELQNSSLRIQMAGDAINLLHEARHYFNQQAIRSSSEAESSSTDYVGLAFVALAAEVQANLQLDEAEKAARTLRQGLDELRPALTQLMEAVLACSCHYLRPEFLGKIDLDLLLWLHNGFRRMQRGPGEITMELTTNELFDRLLRKKIGKVFKSSEGWHGDIPQAVLDTSSLPDFWIGPVNQGTDKKKRGKFVIEHLAEGLNKIVGLVEAHDRLLAQVLQLDEMQQMELKPSNLQAQLQLPEGQAAAVVLDANWIPQKVVS